MRVRNDLNCGTWDYQYNQQLDSQSRVWTWRRWLLGNIIIPDSCGRGLGAFSKIYLFDAWEKTRIEDRRRGLGRIRNIDKIELNFPGKMKLFPTGISNLGDWGYDELTSVANGLFRHEILFSSDATIIIDFRQVSVHRKRAK